MGHRRGRLRDAGLRPFVVALAERPDYPKPLHEAKEHMPTRKGHDKEITRTSRECMTPRL